MITLYIVNGETNKVILTNGKRLTLTEASFKRVINLWEAGKVKVTEQIVFFLGLKTTFERV